MAHYPADTFQEATEIAIEASNQLHSVINGDANAEVIVEDGSKIPSVRKAMVDSLYFKPPIAWAQGGYEDTFSQLRAFNGSWWFSPTATTSTPSLMDATPVGDSSWVLFTNKLVTVPATATSQGVEGQYAVSSDYFYVCVDYNTWKRVAITTW